MNLIDLDIYAARQGTLPLMPEPVAGVDEPRAIAAPRVASDAPSWPACLGPSDKDKDEDKDEEDDEDDEGDEDEDEDDEEDEEDEEDDEGEDEDDEDEDKDDKEGGEPPKPTRRA